MPRKIALYLSVPAAALAALLWSSCGGADLDESFSVRPGGELSVDIVLGSGVSFDRGSLEITSHPANAVRVVAEVSGWGEYAVDLDAAALVDQALTDFDADALDEPLLTNLALALSAEH